MAVIRPFRALRPTTENAEQVASVPYDVVTVAEARALAAGNPLSFLHVIRPEIDLPEGTGLYADVVYEKAGENYSKLKEEGVLIEEEEPSFYIYRLSEGGHEQVGLAACCSVEEYERGRIRKHEHTVKEKEDDRLRNMLTLSAYPGPILMTYRAKREIDILIRDEMQGPALYDFVAPDGVQHTLWRVKKADKIDAAFHTVPLLYIADGHHRAAAAGRVKQHMLERYPDARSDAEFRFFPAVIFPSDQMQILPYNRYVCDFGGMSEKKFLAAVCEFFEMTVDSNPEPREKGRFGMYLGGKWYGLRPKGEFNADEGDPVSVLDLSVFSKHLFEPVLGIVDQKEDRRIDFIGGADSVKKIEIRVDAEGGVGFTFHPVSVDELLAVAEADMIMPPKSTWFAPKIRSGLLVHQF
jgi:uncharacterized protein (DUF1015 family)